MSKKNIFGIIIMIVILLLVLVPVLISSLFKEGKEPFVKDAKEMIQKFKEQSLVSLDKSCFYRISNINDEEIDINKYEGYVIKSVDTGGNQQYFINFWDNKNQYYYNNIDESNLDKDNVEVSKKNPISYFSGKSVCKANSISSIEFRGNTICECSEE